LSQLSTWTACLGAAPIVCVGGTSDVIDVVVVVVQGLSSFRFQYAALERVDAGRDRLCDLWPNGFVGGGSLSWH